MPNPQSAIPNPSEETLPPGRVVRWIALAAVVLASVGLYFRFGLQTPPLGNTPAATTPASTP